MRADGLQDFLLAPLSVSYGTLASSRQPVQCGDLILAGGEKCLQPSGAGGRQAPSPIEVSGDPLPVHEYRSLGASYFMNHSGVP